MAELLLAHGVPVRAFVRSIDERSDQLKALGAEIFQGDFLDVRSVKRAVQGVASVYFAYPVQDGLSAPPGPWLLQRAKKALPASSIS